MADKSKKPRRRKKDKSLHEGGLLLAGASLNIFGSLPLDIHFLYYLGSLPFAIGFLYFWFDMSQSAYAEDRLVLWSLVLPLLFVWMKCWQSIYVNKLNNWIYGVPLPVYTLRAVIRLIMFNAIVQPSGFIVIPVSMILGFPYMLAGFFYQDVLLSEHLYEEGFFSSCRNSYRCAKQDYSQGLTLMWLFSPWQMGIAVLMICFIIFIHRYFGMAMVHDGSTGLLVGSIVFQITLVTCLLSPVAAMLAAGIAGTAFLLPWALEHLFGIETSLSHGYKTMLTSTSFVAVVYFLVYLLLDPLMKIATITRRFQYNSLSNGEDILLALKEFSRRARKGAGMIIFFMAISLAFLLPSKLTAESDTGRGTLAEKGLVPGAAGQREQLDAALDETLRHPRYTWRMPRQLKKKDVSDDLPEWYKPIDKFMKQMQEKLKEFQEAFQDWLDELFNDRKDTDSSKFSWLMNIGLAEGIFYLLLCAVLLTVLIMLLKWLRTRQQLMTVTRKEAVKVQVDVLDHGLSPDALPPDEWLALASSLVSQGDYRSAMRALFLGVLAKLGESGFVTLRAYKSNYDYRRELDIRARDRMEIITLFKWLCRLMECTWYGFVPVTEEMWKEYHLKSASLRHECSSEVDADAEEVVSE